MLSSLFTSLYQTSSQTTANPWALLLSLGSSFGLGLALVQVYRYKATYTQEFLITLALLPSVMTMVIFMVNGNLGTGVAVAGTFSLVRFRSAAGGARELLAIFLAMVMGLSLGMGYIILSLSFSFIFLMLWFFYEKKLFVTQASSSRSLSIQIPNTAKNVEHLQMELTQLCQSYDLISLKSHATPNQLELLYHLHLQKGCTDLSFANHLLATLPDVKLHLSKKVKKKKAL
ncbi:DUF4956 domain-containing protein [Streptococcus suis]|nr:DUF4956 domain-containing protein [Streptococcus suis]